MRYEAKNNIQRNGHRLADCDGVRWLSDHGEIFFPGPLAAKVKFSDGLQDRGEAPVPCMDGSP